MDRKDKYKWINWRRNDRLKLEYIKVSYMYLSGRNCFNQGYMSYSYFKNLIRFATGENESYLLRFIFQNLLNQKVFRMRKNGRHTSYIFNPFNKPYSKQYEVDWN